MIATNFTDARNGLKRYCDLAADDFETVIITRKGNKNVILISEAEYNNLLENQYIQANKQLCEKLNKAIQEIQSGKFKQIRKLDEDE
jgi:antitoxin YefM